MTHEDAGRGEELEPDEPPVSTESSTPEVRAHPDGQPIAPGWSWRQFAVVTGGAIVAAGGATVVTLAATRRTAVSENMAAYANGMSDALDAIRKGFDPFDA